MSTYAIFPPDNSFERLFSEQTTVFLAFGIIYTIIAVLQLLSLIRFRSAAGFFFPIAYISKLCLNTPQKATPTI
jgi:hypothetical protein